jgi:hypothetical protein
MSTSDRREPLPMGRLLLWAMLAVAGGAAWLVLLNGVDSARAWRSLLINFLFFSSLGGGLVVWPAVVGTCNGRWHAGVERLAASGIAFAIPSIVALVLLWIGGPAWAPWYRERFYQGGWLDTGFLFGRDLAALVIFWSLSGYYLLLRRHGEARVLAPILILVYSLAFSLLGFDLVMALDPYWHSNLAGGYFVISGLYIAVTCWGFLTAWHPESEPDQRHDIGKLMVAFSLMTTYLMFAHLLPFWYENLPGEIRFLVPRMHNLPWRDVSFFLVGLVYFGPLLLLLTVRSKRNRLSLGTISLAVLIGMWIERWWLVAPTFDPRVRLGVSEISMAAACLGLLGLGMELFQRYVPEWYLRHGKENGAGAAPEGGER